MKNDAKFKSLPVVFVVGNSRSGTTMMGRILSLNKDVFTFRELHFFEQMWTPDDRGKILSRDEGAKLFAKLIKTERIGYLNSGSIEQFIPEALEAIELMDDKDLISENIFKFFLGYEAVLKGKRMACDQTPRNVLYAKEILEMYSDAKILNLIRDPRDILLSQKNKWKRRFLGAKQIPLKESLRSWINYHPITISKLWNQNVLSTEKFKAEPRFLTIKFEELLTDQEVQVTKICDFLGIQFSPDMLSVPQVGSSGAEDVETKFGINPKMTGNWRRGGLNNTEIYLSEVMAGKTMRKFDYQYEKVSPNILVSAFYYVSFPAKLGTSFLMNLHRMKNIRQSLKRRLSSQK